MKEQEKAKVVPVPCYGKIITFKVIPVKSIEDYVRLNPGGKIVQITRLSKLSSQLRNKKIEHDRDIIPI
jgi:hypothetical protein